jgi:tetratricopeptide (TPR) repeat protein
VLTARDPSAPLKPNPASSGNAAFALPDSDNPEAMHAESQLHGQLLMHDLAGAMESLRRAVAADPEFTRAWALLAELYMDVGKPEESIEALHRAINSDPKSPIPRKLLASALTGPYRHPDEAITAWQELLELTPQDHDATQTLGGLFISQKRFAEAISLLETATRENPNNTDLRVSLGKTYLLSGNPEKAISAFDTALKIRPGADMKNEIGYILADANVKLPEALQYAKEAVQEEETASRDVHLEKLEVGDLSHTRLLAAYWDTLGWAYFRMDNLHEAEACLFAAFHLSQDAINADHLGQVYEKDHKPDAAIRMYRLALAQTVHPPETQERLDHMARTNTKSDSSFQGGAELSQMRTTKVGRLVPGSASAEFFFLFAPGPKVEGVKFVSGSEELRTASKILATTAFNVPFPTGSDARILRRGILGCHPTIRPLSLIRKHS